MKTICITCKADCHNAGTMARIIECSSYEPGRVLTNADRIRAMSDEELATMLFDYKECSKNCIMNSGKHCYEICEEESCILKWLQQPTEVTNGR